MRSLGPSATSSVTLLKKYVQADVNPCGPQRTREGLARQLACVSRTGSSDRWTGRTLQESSTICHEGVSKRGQQCSTCTDSNDARHQYTQALTKGKVAECVDSANRVESRCLCR